MNKNYMTYPVKFMRITQTYLGKTSHLAHTTGSVKDYPIDEAGKDTGRDPIYCPCDEMVVTAVKGYGNNKVTNTIWLVSTSPVVTPTFTDICFMTLTHENDSDIKDLKVGQKFQRGDIICYEGTNGASANHIHIVVGRGSSNNWTQSSSGSWVMVGDTKKPEEVFYIDPSFTTVLSTNGLSFSHLPQEEEQKEDNPIEDEKEQEVEEGSKPEESPRLIFECKESKYYKIFLKENMKLYLKE